AESDRIKHAIEELQSESARAAMNEVSVHAISPLEEHTFGTFAMCVMERGIRNIVTD
uniref:Heavy metal-binding domain-containing protein n=1 Tax=Steinernema glaseri TaxID=37863 RepID=A0A1I8A976_9BILA